MTDKAPERIWIDLLGIPESAKFAGTYYLDDDDDHLTEAYVRADIHEAVKAERDALREFTEFVSEKIAFEINPSNYTHEQVCEMNAAWCEIGLAADAALQEKNE